MNRSILKWKTHCAADRLTSVDKEYQAWILRFTTDEMEKDVGKGDVTTQAFFTKPAKKKAIIVAKEEGVLAGVQEIRFFLKNFKKIRAVFLKEDGSAVKPNDVIAQLEGDIRHLMAAERIILNLLGRMSGVATMTSQYVKKAKKTNPKILLTPTRKTLWGWLDKRACVLGGGGTHRLSLNDAMLIKHNHLRASGVPIGKYLEKSLQHANGRFVEIEVRNAEDAIQAATVFQRAAKSGFQIPCIIMFDNMFPYEIAPALQAIRKAKLDRTVLFEASGRINLTTLPSFVETGVDILSIGALTHSAPMLDLSMRITSP